MLTLDYVVALTVETPSHAQLQALHIGNHPMPVLVLIHLVDGRGGVFWRQVGLFFSDWTKHHVKRLAIVSCEAEAVYKGLTK